MNTKVLLAVALTFSTSVIADECQNASSQQALNDCTATQYQTADKLLNAAYQRVAQRAPQPQQALLKTAQQHWLALRDADCAFISAGAQGGSLQTMIHHQCLTEKTVERTAWLESLLNCEEGDVSCPLPPAP